MEFRKKIKKPRLPKLFKNSKIVFKQTKDNKLISFPPRETGKGALIVGIVYEDNSWEIRNINDGTVSIKGNAKNVIDAKKKVRYAMKQMGVKTNTTKKGI